MWDNKIRDRKRKKLKQKQKQSSCISIRNERKLNETKKKILVFFFIRILCFSPFQKSAVSMRQEQLKQNKMTTNWNKKKIGKELNMMLSLTESSAYTVSMFYFVSFIIKKRNVENARGTSPMWIHLSNDIVERRTKKKKWSEQKIFEFILVCGFFKKRLKKL